VAPKDPALVWSRTVRPATPSLPTLQLRKVTDYILVSGVGPYLTLYFRNLFVNSLDDTFLRVEFQWGPPKLPTLMVFDEPRRIRSLKLEFRLLSLDGRTGYFDPADDRTYSPDELAEHLLRE
jgi:hypothetical protein